MKNRNEIELPERLNNLLQLLSNSMYSFQLSIEKCKNFVDKKDLSFTKQESLDSLITKFNRISIIYIDKILFFIWDIKNGKFAPLKDRMVLMEKMGVFLSSEQLLKCFNFNHRKENAYSQEELIGLIPEIIFYSEILKVNIKATEQFLSDHNLLNI